MAFNIAPYIDHTILKPVATDADIRQLCSEAATHSFAAVCVPPYYISKAVSFLQGTGVKVATVIGFPFGYNSTAAKLEEIRTAIADGADELDIVHNIAAVKNGDWGYLQREAEACIALAHANGRVIKIIIESGVLTDEEIIHCCELYTPFQPDFLKTSTGYAETGATIHALALMRSHLPATIAIKASGGIRNFAFARQLITAGAVRLGCSAGVQLLEQGKNAGS